MPADPEYEAYHEGYRSLGADRGARGVYVAGALRGSRNPGIARHAFAVALTLFRENDLDGFFEVLDGFLEGNPGSVPEEGTTRSHLELLGTSPFATRTPPRAVAERFLLWIRDRLQGSAHPALLETARTLMLGCAAGTTADLVRIVGEASYPDEATRARVRQIYLETVCKTVSELAHTDRGEEAVEFGKRALARAGDDPALQAQVVLAVLAQKRAGEAFALGVDWLTTQRGRVELLAATVEAAVAAGLREPAVQLFSDHAPPPVDGWIYGQLVQLVAESWLELGRPDAGAEALERILGSGESPPRIGWHSAHLGSLHAAAGNLPRALQLAQAAIAGGVTRAWLRENTAFRGMHEASAEFRAMVAPPPMPDPLPFDEENDGGNDGGGDGDDP